MNNRVWMSGDQHTIPWLLEHRLESDPDGEYLDVNGQTITARGVHDVAGRVANALLALGIGQGDRVATLIENSIEATLAWWGIVHAGAIAVPINTAYKGQYLQHQLHDSGSRVVIVGGDLFERLERVCADLAHLEHVIVIDEVAPTLPGVPTMRWSELLDADPEPPALSIRPSDLGTFIYTGGTTGPSKGCMLSHNYHEALAQIGRAHV